ncbi:hypothetical protein ACOSP7_013404 [Xanthoceras sorbifolium]
MKFDGFRIMHEHVIEMTNIVAKLKHGLKRKVRFLTTKTINSNEKFVFIGN